MHGRFAVLAVDREVQDLAFKSPTKHWQHSLSHYSAHVFDSRPFSPFAGWTRSTNILARFDKSILHEYEYWDC